MARLSGLPSEHHHEGPGDAPRRKRGRPSKKDASDAEMQLATKRAASPTVESSQTKRTKRVAVDDDEYQITEEVELSYTQPEQGDDVHDNIDVDTGSNARRRTNRRHSEPLVTAADDHEDVAYPNLPSTQPVAGLTPHLNRIGAPQQFTNIRRARMSMPPKFQIEPVDEVDENDNLFQFKPLTEVLSDRARRQLRRSHLSQEINTVEEHKKRDKKTMMDLYKQLRSQDDKIKELEYQLEARRLGDIDITDEHAEQLQQQLAEARDEVDVLRASSIYNGDDEPDQDMFDDEDETVLVNPDELSFSQDLAMVETPHGKYSSRVIELSRQVTFESLPGISQLTHDTLVEDEDTTVPDRMHDQAVERYEREIKHYVDLLAESQGALRVITVALQNLNVIEPGASTDQILTELRHSLEIVRDEVEKYFPNTTAGLTNQQLLHKVPQLFSGLFFELRENLTLLKSSQKTEVLLRRQYEGVLGLLGDSEERVQQLEKDVFTLDKSNEEKQRTILDLEDRIDSLDGLTESQASGLAGYETQISELQANNEEQEIALERLREALEKYRQDLDVVTQTATDFEAEHHEMITRMEQEHAAAVQALEDELANEQDAREAVEADALQKGEYIEELEGRIAGMEGEVDAISSQVVALREKLTTQTQTLHDVEATSEEQTEVIYQHTNTIENMEEDIKELKEEIGQLRNQLAIEEDEHKETRSNLEGANDKIADLDERLHDAGLQANELRSKLFQVQQEKEQTIAQLQEDAQEREDELNRQLDDEETLRVEAQETVIQLEQQIAEIQANLVSAEDNVTALTATREELMQDRDTQVTNLKSHLADLTAKYAALENSTNSTITSLQANITDLNNQVQRQQAEIKRLADEITEKEALFVEETTTLKETIEILEQDFENQKAENESYRKENASLSQRVEDEANELLNIMGAHTEEATSLHTAISSHEATIKTLQEAAAQRATEFDETLQDRDREITELRLMGDARVETIVYLEAQVTDIKKRFEAQEEDTRVTVNALMLSQRQLQEQNEQLAEALKARNAEALKAVQEMKINRVEIKTQSLDLHRVVNGKVLKTSEKVKFGKKGKKKVAKRQWDSGFGVDENVEDVEDGEELNGAGAVVA